MSAAVIACFSAWYAWSRKLTFALSGCSASKTDGAAVATIVDTGRVLRFGRPRCHRGKRRRAGDAPLIQPQDDPRYLIYQKPRCASASQQRADSPLTARTSGRPPPG